MADFVAVLRKTIGALGDNTPEMRERVYDKARTTIEAKLAAITPPPPAPVVERQMKALEDAIAVVRADYEVPAPDTDNELDEVLDSLNMLGTGKPDPAPPAPVPVASADPAAPAPLPVTAGLREPRPATETVPADRDEPDAAAAPDGIEPVELRHRPPDREAIATAVAQRRGRPGRGFMRRHGGMIAAVAVLLAVVSAGGYGVWTNRDAFSGLFGSGQQEQAEEPAVSTAEELVEAPPAEPEVPDEEVAALAPAGEESGTPAAAEAESAVPAAPAGEGPEKFTQRLLADGSEVDEGPAGGPSTIGEGTSVASAATAGEPPAESAGEAETTPDQPASAPSLAVGQRVIFYEERTSQAEASAEPGTIVWSVVRESPGGALPPEPAIRAEATIPGKDLQLRMTIRRNGDRTLPAGHIVEMIFLTPDGFEGGSIANVSRISFKQTEQDTGNPLIGIPAKIADGFFLIALSDAPSEMEVNTSLLRIQRWLDIPIVYESGRRALLSIEKGIPGERVFEDVLRAWGEDAPTEQAG